MCSRMKKRLFKSGAGAGAGAGAFSSGKNLCGGGESGEELSFGELSMFCCVVWFSGGAASFSVLAVAAALD